MAAFLSAIMILHWNHDICTQVEMKEDEIGRKRIKDLRAMIQERGKVCDVQCTYQI